MSIVETRRERSLKFEFALRLKETFNPENEEHRAIAFEAYEAAVILLEPMRLRKLKAKDIDHRFLELLEFVILPYHRLVSQHGLEFFERLRKTGEDFPELGLLRTRKHDLIEKWKETYSKKRQFETPYEQDQSEE